jgi:putative ABC transport system permease protein
MGWLDDLRFGLRMLARNRVLSAVAVLILALGVGLNTAIVSILARALWTPFDYPEPDRLVSVLQSNTVVSFKLAPAAYAEVQEWRKAGSFQGMAAYRMEQVTLAGAGEPESVLAVEATPDFFHVLRVQPAIGRGFDASEQPDGDHRVVLLADEAWQRTFQGDPAVLGREIRIDGRSHTIIGVLPRDFQFLYSKAQIYVPLRLPPRELSQRIYRGVNTIARLAPGITLARAQAQMDSISARMARETPESNRNFRAQVLTLDELVVKRSVRTALHTLFWAVTVVLLIGCGNIASLLLARGTLRERELAIRAALGAGRARLGRLLLAEALALAGAGGALGIGGAYAAMPLLRKFVPDSLPPVAASATVDERALAYALLLCVASGLVAGILPAWTQSRAQAAGALHQGSRGSTMGRHRLLQALVFGEVALTVVLLACGGLMVRSLLYQVRSQPGFATDHLLTARVSLPASRYEGPTEKIVFYQRVLDELRRDPGVVAASAVQSIPLGGSNSFTYVELESSTCPNTGKWRAFEWPRPATSPPCAFRFSRAATSPPPMTPITRASRWSIRPWCGAIGRACPRPSDSASSSRAPETPIPGSPWLGWWAMSGTTASSPTSGPRSICRWRNCRS